MSKGKTDNEEVTFLTMMIGTSTNQTSSFSGQSFPREPQNQSKPLMMSLRMRGWSTKSRISLSLARSGTDLASTWLSGWDGPLSTTLQVPPLTSQSLKNGLLTLCSGSQRSTSEIVLTRSLSLMPRIPTTQQSIFSLRIAT